jgi:hypothetical protein
MVGHPFRLSPYVRNERQDPSKERMNLKWYKWDVPGSQRNSLVRFRQYVRPTADLRRTVTVSPSPQSKDEENEKLHKLREYARDFRRQHTTDAEQFDWDSDDGDYGLAIGRLVVM